MSDRTPAARRVVMVGIDAAEHTLIHSMVARGKLPALAKFMREGTSGLLESPADLYSGAVWPTFYTGQRPEWHGVYHNKLWRPERMCCVVPDARRFTASPFWEDLDRHGLRTCVIDVPLVLGTPRTSRGVYLGGWATHDPVVNDSLPPQLWRDVRREFGQRKMPAENFGPQTVRSLQQLCGELLGATDQLERIGVSLLRREPWDFACVIFGAVHRAGHYLWDAGEARDLGRAPQAVREQLQGAVERVYEAIDGALSRLLAACPDDALSIVFSLHGMGPNSGWSELVPGILDARRSALGQSPARKGMLYGARRALVSRLRAVLQHVPASLAAQLVPLWSSGMFDWPRTEYFPLPMDLTGLLRINLRGRERDGIVSAGHDYETLCAQLEGFFHSLRDATTHEPIVADVVRAYAGAPADAPERAGQPDLIVRWRQIRTRDVRRISSDRVDGFAYDIPAFVSSGRSGNHQPLGWFVSRGPGVAAGATLATHRILDLAPTVREYLGLDPDPGLHGRPLPLHSRPSTA